MNSCTVEYLRQQILGEMVGFISVFSGFISKWKVKEIFEGLLKSVYIGQSYHKEKSGTVFLWRTIYSFRGLHLSPDASSTHGRCIAG